MKHGRINGIRPEMKKVWIIADNIVSPLGTTSEQNYQQVRNGKTGIQRIQNRLNSTPVQVAKLQDIVGSESLTRFEFYCQQVISNVLRNQELNCSKTLLILSTTKGNIELLESGGSDYARIHLHATALKLSTHFGFANQLVISNACTSGVMALIAAKRFLENGTYDHAIVVGADMIGEFIISGFQSLMALSDELCKPFDVNRQGINLGEAATAIVLTSTLKEFRKKPDVRIAGGGTSNDANHISGPSRTGEELSFAISQAIGEANIDRSEIDFISAHGTATVYNDEMEAKAFSHARLNEVPVHSLKGNFGHTLGAAGVLETIMSLHSLYNNEILPTKGFNSIGVSQSITISDSLLQKPLTTFLKTASGFGGCNAAIILLKENE